MRMIKICECGCKTQTRKTFTTYIHGLDGAIPVNQISNVCDDCGRDFLTGMDRNYNARMLAKGKEEALSRINVND